MGEQEKMTKIGVVFIVCRVIWINSDTLHGGCHLFSPQRYAEHLEEVNYEIFKMTEIGVRSIVWEVTKLIGNRQMTFNLKFN